MYVVDCIVTVICTSPREVSTTHKNMLRQALGFTKWTGPHKVDRKLEST